MQCKSRIYVFLALFICQIGLTSRAEGLSTHFVIAFDQSLETRFHDAYRSGDVLNSVNVVLKNAGYDDSRDYVSVVGYSLAFDNPSVEDFVRPYLDADNNPLIWSKIKSGDLKTAMSNWPYGQPVFNTSTRGSMQSMAKPFAVMETKRQATASTPRMERTLLLMVTDEVVNGHDDNYANEYQRAGSCVGANTARFRELEGQFFGQIREFNEKFKFVQAFDKSVVLGDYKVVPYEVLSADMPSLYSVTDFPSPLPLQRVKGGFRLDTDVAATNGGYAIEKILVFRSNGSCIAYSPDGALHQTLSSGDLTPGDTLYAELTLALNDGLYDGAVISPHNPRYANGMTSRQVVRIQDEAKVLGIVPLSDAFWWWFPNDIFTAVMIWDLIILMIVIVAVAYVLYRSFVAINAYSPSNDKIKITKV